MSDLKLITSDIEKEIVLRIKDSTKHPIPIELVDPTELMKELYEKNPMRSIMLFNASQSILRLAPQWLSAMMYLASALGIDPKKITENEERNPKAEKLKKFFGD
ncbi:MAG: hypothetical protein U9O96_00025 [Candidatus Thermoplasmatota archaeon]|nr:hypothetical protein [Candidatus Thermoplasmatota archaeon]